MQLLTKADASWQEYFNSAQVRPFTIVYEDFVTNYDETLRAVFHHLGLDEHCKETWKKPRMRKQADDLSEQWVQQFYTEKREELQA
jgi:LPS sulfotransferase NodH